MITYAQQNSEEQTDATSQAVDDHIAPAPRVSVQAFCETVETAAAVQSAGEDRRLAKAHLKIQMGGMAAAIEAYRSAPTPNVIILETEGRGDILAEPFKWGLDLSSSVVSPAQREFFAEAAEFGIRRGFTVPIHDGHGPVAALTFAADERWPQFEKRIEMHTHILQFLALYFHANVRRRLNCGADADGVLLSPREFECLEWASQGKTAWEIGRILGISRNTVAYHLQNAKEKLGVRTVVQAVARLTAAKAEKRN